MWNIIEVVFLLLAGSAWLGGEAVSRWRHNLPPVIVQSYLYGSFAHRGKESAMARRFELPKSAFRHFYVLAALLGSTALGLMLAAYGGGIEPPYPIRSLLMGLLQRDQPAVCAAAALTAMLLLTLQVWRRTYETQRLQVFSSHGRMNLSHYAAGFIHYLGCIVTLLGQAPLFSTSGSARIKWLDSYTALTVVPFSFLFLSAWYEQYRTNVILANLRRDEKSGAVVSERHDVPHGRCFHLVSSPHRLTEILMYTSLLVLTPTRTFLCIYLWVLANQVETALQAHQWYQSNFQNYPKQRMAVFPYIL